MGLGTQIGLIIILLHLILGFGFMIYKLAPRKGDNQAVSPDDHDV